MDCENRTRLFFTSMTIHSSFPLRLDQLGIFFAEIRRHDIDNIIAWTRQLDLREVGNQIIISAMGVDEDDLLESIARDFAAYVLKQTDRQRSTSTHSARIMACFQDLS